MQLELACHGHRFQVQQSSMCQLLDERLAGLGAEQEPRVFQRPTRDSRCLAPLDPPAVCIDLSAGPLGLPLRLPQHSLLSGTLKTPTRPCDDTPIHVWLRSGRPISLIAPATRFPFNPTPSF
jgi:hypothetical protein